MKQIELVALRTLRITEAPKPEPGPGEALIRMRRMGICGSDMHLFRTGEVGGLKSRFPHVIGHECMGVVEAVGAGVGESLVGRRVAIEPHRSCGVCRWCRTGRSNVCMNDRFLGTPPEPGALKEYIVLPADQAVPVPDNVSDDEAVMTEPMAIALHAVRLLKAQPGQDAVILGTGVIGTCVLLALSLYRGINTICVDLLDHRIERARRLGATHTILAEEGKPEDVARRVMELTGGKGAELVFECVGCNDTFINSIKTASPCGHVGIIGIPDEDWMPLPASFGRRRGVTIRLVRRSLGTLEPCIELAARGVLRAEQLVTHTFPASRVQEGFELVEAAGDHVLKAMIDLESW